MEQPTYDLHALLRPRSVAIVGASANPDSPGHDYLRSLIDFGFAGELYPVHPRESEILGRTAYPDVRAIPGEVEFVISTRVADPATPSTWIQPPSGQHQISSDTRAFSSWADCRDRHRTIKR